MKTIIFCCGIYSAGFAIFHLFFWRLFRWKEDLKKLSFANRGIMQILNVQLTFYFFMTAFFCFVYPSGLMGTTLGRAFLAGNALFWLVRTVQQFTFLRANDYRLHVLTVIFIAGTILFSLPLLLR